MASPIFNRELAAKVIAEAELSGSKATCKKHGISERTLRRWHKRLEDGDSSLGQAVQTKRSAVEAVGDWAEQLPGAIQSAIDFLKRAAEQADVNDPDVIHSVAGGLKILTDVATSRRVLDARLNKATGNAGSTGSDRTAGEAARPPLPSAEDRLGLQ